MKRFRMAVSYRQHADPAWRPPLPAWLAEERKAEILRLPYSAALRVSYTYWRKLYWATPPWLTPAMERTMKRIYGHCPAGFHVDHEVPLDGRNVCGLNVPWNLQYLPEKENLRKSAREWPDCPHENLDLFPQPRGQLEICL